MNAASAPPPPLDSEYYDKQQLNQVMKEFFYTGSFCKIDKLLRYAHLLLHKIFNASISVVSRQMVALFVMMNYSQ